MKPTWKLAALFAASVALPLLGWGLLPIHPQQEQLILPPVKVAMLASVIVFVLTFLGAAGGVSTLPRSGSTAWNKVVMHGLVFLLLTISAFWAASFLGTTAAATPYLLAGMGLWTVVGSALAVRLLQKDTNHF